MMCSNDGFSTGSNVFMAYLQRWCPGLCVVHDALQRDRINVARREAGQRILAAQGHSCCCCRLPHLHPCRHVEDVCIHVSPVLPCLKITTCLARQSEHKDQALRRLYHQVQCQEENTAFSAQGLSKRAICPDRQFAGPCKDAKGCEFHTAAAIAGCLDHRPSEEGSGACSAPSSRSRQQEDTACLEEMGAHLAKKPLGPAEGLRRVLRVAHLDAGQRECSAMLRADLHERIVAVTVGGVVVTGGQLCRMAARAVPPVDARNLEAHLHRRAGRLFCHPHLPAHSRGPNQDYHQVNNCHLFRGMHAARIPRAD